MSLTLSFPKLCNSTPTPPALFHRRKESLCFSGSCLQWLTLTYNLMNGLCCMALREKAKISIYCGI